MESVEVIGHEQRPGETLMGSREDQVKEDAGYGNYSSSGAPGLVSSPSESGRTGTAAEAAMSRKPSLKVSVQSGRDHQRHHPYDEYKSHKQGLGKIHDIIEDVNEKEHKEGTYSPTEQLFLSPHTPMIQEVVKEVVKEHPGPADRTSSEGGGDGGGGGGGDTYIASYVVEAPYSSPGPALSPFDSPTFEDDDVKVVVKEIADECRQEEEAYHRKSEQIASAATDSEVPSYGEVLEVEKEEAAETEEAADVDEEGFLKRFTSFAKEMLHPLPKLLSEGDKRGRRTELQGTLLERIGALEDLLLQVEQDESSTVKLAATDSKVIPVSFSSRREGSLTTTEAILDVQEKGSLLKRVRMLEEIVVAAKLTPKSKLADEETKRVLDETAGVGPAKRVADLLTGEQGAGEAFGQMGETSVEGTESGSELEFPPVTIVQVRSTSVNGSGQVDSYAAAMGSPAGEARAGLEPAVTIVRVRLPGHRGGQSTGQEMRYVIVRNPRADMPGLSTDSEAFGVAGDHEEVKEPLPLPAAEPQVSDHDNQLGTMALADDGGKLEMGHGKQTYRDDIESSEDSSSSEEFGRLGAARGTAMPVIKAPTVSSSDQTSETSIGPTSADDEEGEKDSLTTEDSEYSEDIRESQWLATPRTESRREEVGDMEKFVFLRSAHTAHPDSWHDVDMRILKPHDSPGTVRTHTWERKDAKSWGGTGSEPVPADSLKTGAMADSEEDWQKMPIAQSPLSARRITPAALLQGPGVVSLDVSEDDVAHGVPEKKDPETGSWKDVDRINKEWPQTGRGPMRRILKGLLSGTVDDETWERIVAEARSGSVGKEGGMWSDRSVGGDELERSASRDSSWRHVEDLTLVPPFSAEEQEMLRAHATEAMTEGLEPGEHKTSSEQRYSDAEEKSEITAGSRRGEETRGDVSLKERAHAPLWKGLIELPENDGAQTSSDAGDERQSARNGSQGVQESACLTSSMSLSLPKASPRTPTSQGLSDAASTVSSASSKQGARKTKNGRRRRSKTEDSGLCSIM